MFSLLLYHNNIALLLLIYVSLLILFVMERITTKYALAIAESLFIIGGMAVRSGYYLVFKSDETEQMYFVDFDDPSAARDMVQLFKSFGHVRCSISV